MQLECVVLAVNCPAIRINYTGHLVYFGSWVCGQTHDDLNKNIKVRKKIFKVYKKTILSLFCQFVTTLEAYL